MYTHTLTTRGPPTFLTLYMVDIKELCTMITTCLAIQPHHTYKKQLHWPPIIVYMLNKLTFMINGQISSQRQFWSQSQIFFSIFVEYFKSVCTFYYKALIFFPFFVLYWIYLTICIFNYVEIWIINFYEFKFQYHSQFHSWEELDIIKFHEHNVWQAYKYQCY